MRTDTLVGNSHKAKDWPEPVVTIAYFRHPLARLASVWNHLIRDSWYTSFKELEFTRDMTFPEFCIHLLSIRDEFLDPHLEQQDINFRACRAWLGDTHIYRLDEIDTSWPQMCRTWDLDCTSQVAHMNRRDYPDGKPWTALYEQCPELIFKLKDMYRHDLQIWQERAAP